MYLHAHGPGPLRSLGQKYSGFQNRDTATNKIVSRCKPVFPFLYNNLGMKQIFFKAIFIFSIDF